jgi:hypothetical protein
MDMKSLSSKIVLNECEDNLHQFTISTSAEIFSNQPIYDNYTSEAKEGNDGDMKEFYEQFTKPFSSLVVADSFLEVSKPIFDTYVSTSSSDIEQVGIGIIEEFSSSSLFSANYEHEFGIIQEVKVCHEHPIQFKQREEVFSYEFYDPIATYLEEFIYSDPLSWFHCKYEFHDPLMFDVKHSIPTKYVREVWSVNQLLTWLHWKDDYT